MFNNQHWYGVSRRDPRVVGLYSRHYSSKKNNKTVDDWLRCGVTAPGESITLLSSDGRALFIWLKQKYVKNDQTGINCVVFRNEGAELASLLILEAEKFAFEKWGNERLYTYVDPDEIKSKNAGYCFKRAGWRLVRDDQGKPRKTTHGLLIFEK